MLPLGFILAVAWIPGWTGGAIPTGWVVLSLALPFMVRRTTWQKGHCLLAVFFCYVTVSLAWTPSFLDGIGSWWQWGILVAAFWWGSEQETLEPLFAGLGYGLLVSIPIALAQGLDWHVVPSVGVAGLYFNPNILASIAVLVMIGLFLHERYWLAASLSPLLIMAPSRAAIAALGVTACWRGWKSGLGGWALIPLLLAGALIAASGKAYLPRIEIWEYTFRSLTFFGSGVGSFEILTALGRVEHAHNDILEVIFLFGLGAIPLLLLPFSFEARNVPELTTLLAALVLGLFSFPLFSPITAFVCMVCAGYLCVPRAVCVRRGSTVSPRLADWRQIGA